MTVTELHLLTFLDRLDVIRKNLHLRPLTDREIEDLITTAGFTTSTEGVYNPVFSRIAPHPEPQHIKPRNPYEDKKFSFTIVEPLTIISKRKYQYNHNISIKKPISGNLSSDCYVLIPLTVNEINRLTVIGFNITKIKNKLKIFTPCKGTQKSNIDIITMIKSKVLGIIDIKTKIFTSRKGRLNIQIQLEQSKDKTSLQNQSIYVNDVGEIGDLELLEIIGDLNFKRHT